LVPLDSTAIGSNCPTSKSVIVRLEAATEDGDRGDTHIGAPVGADEGHKSDFEPYHIS
jgi:formate dehydrogenase major subunit